ncbi:hypothetical protein [Desulfonema magnum]|uniref:Uncharacterized protein n=1 Tax=Desulfonema magnum TaxID=45655 RepID=A0A975BL77_9BACT|nr:hypothetical protein [Desulfonema magnum]QTA87441.1 Uncharacterized protein dnm_034750 [Desulfonema magnum]
MKKLERFSKDDLLMSAGLPNRSELTKAGRALQKHGNRTSSAFPKVSGNPEEIDRVAQGVVKAILNTPNCSHTCRRHARFGEITDIRTPDGRGIRYDADGNFIGFLEP